MTGGSRNSVLVLGDDMRIFLAIARSLGRAGYAVHAAPFDWRAPALQSRYVARVHRLPRYSDNPARWLAEISTLVDEHEIRLIIPCDDRAILPLDRHRSAFENTILAIPSPVAVETLFDKAQTKALASGLGIPVSPWDQLRPGDSADDLISRFGLPLVVKPKRSYSFDSLTAWGRVHICETREQLIEILASIREPGSYLVEQYFKNGVGVGVSVLADRGNVVQAFQHLRLREGWGSSSSLRVSENCEPQMLAAVEKVCREMKIHGVCMFEFRRNAGDQSWILLEVNARFWGSLSLSLSMGIDFPLALCRLLLERKIECAQAYRAGIRSRNIVLDGINLLKAMRKGQIGGISEGLAATLDYLAMPLWWILGREHSDSFTFDDPKPGFAEIGDVIARVARPRSPQRDRRPGDRMTDAGIPAVSARHDH